jgi:signal transduction histidine kinase
MCLAVLPFLQIFLCCLLKPAFGQQAQMQNGLVYGYDVVHFTDENGLPQNSVKSIVSDSRGNIWLATERGLVRFDGNRFLNFDNLGNSFVARSIYGFSLDPQSSKGNFLAMTSNQSWVRMIDGKAMIDTTLKGYPLYRSAIVAKGRNLHLLEALPDLNEAALAYYRHGIASVYPAPAGRHFVYDEQNIGYYVNNKLTKLYSFPGKSFFRFFRLGQSLYHLDENLKLTRFAATSNSQQPIESILAGPITKDATYQARGQHSIFWNNCSDQAFVLTGQRLYEMRPSKDGSLASTLILEGFDFQGKDIKTIYMDRKTGRLFLGSQLQGLYIVTKKQFRTLTDPSAKSNNVYYGQALLDSETIATLPGAAFSINGPNKGSVVPLHLLKKHISWDNYSIIRDRAGTLWSKRRETLFRFEGNGKRILSSWTMSDEIKILYEGPNGRIWIGTNSAGLYYIDPSVPNAGPHFFQGRNLSNISWIQHQGSDIVWIGTGKGLYKIHLHSRKLSRITKLNGIYIRSLYIPQGHDEIWITTYTNGIYLLKDSKLTSFPSDKYRYLSSAHCIIEDKAGYFWVTTNKGLFQFSKADLLSYAKKPFKLYHHYYPKTVGFNTNEFNGGCQPCGLRTPRGIVSFPSINGLVWFVPERVRAELPDGKIFIDAPDSYDSTFTADRGKVSVQAGVRQILLKVTTPYFGEPYNLRMSYRLFKGDEPLTAWQDLEESRNISVPIPGGGKYKLVVRKLAGFGVNNYIDMQVDIDVQEQWHETWWFKGIVVTTVLLLFYIISQQRVKVIKRQNIALEEKVKERTEDLEKTLSVLSNSEKLLEQQVKLQIHMIGSISHDIRTPVKHMSYALEYSQRLIEEKKLDSLITFLKQLKQATDNMYQMIDNLVNFIKPEMGVATTAFMQVRLNELVKEKLSLFDQITKASNVNVKVDIASDQTVFTDPKLLGIIIHNVIDNAVKISNGNTLRIYVQTVTSDLHLVFEDNGPGMPSELLRWLNKIHLEEDPGLPTGYEGLGLLLVKQISKILHIQLNVTNSPGACIHLIFKNNNEVNPKL